VHGLKSLLHVQVSAMMSCQGILGKDAKDIPLGKVSQGFM